MVAASDATAPRGPGVRRTPPADPAATAEWGVLSGDLGPLPESPDTQVTPDDMASGDPNVYSVPVEILGLAVAAGYLAAGGDPDDFGPSDLADSLLRADQVPLLAEPAEPVTVPRLPGLPIRDVPPPATRRPGPPLPSVRWSGELPVSGSLPPAPGPEYQDVPPGAAAQLMAQLRGLINELENAGRRDLHPMDVTAWHEPPRR